MILDMWMLLELFESKVLVEIWNANNIHMGPHVYVCDIMGTVVVARIYKGAPCTYYSQRLPFEQADCSPSGLGFYVMIFITTLGSLHKRTIHIGVNQIGLAVT